MLEGKTRIPPVDVETLPRDLRETLEEQRKLRGAPLYPYLFYARNAAFFRAAKEMWAALQQETHRDGEDRGAQRLREEPALQRRGEGGAGICRRDHGHAPRRRRRTVRTRATTLRRRRHRGADDDHRVGERVLALQPGVPHPVARILEAGLTREPRHRVFYPVVRLNSIHTTWRLSETLGW
jgi:hypothetical protein